MAIISSEMWQEALRNLSETVAPRDITTTPLRHTTSPHTHTTTPLRHTTSQHLHTHHFTTPLRKLIRKMPKVAKVVLNKCVVTNAEGEVSIMWLYTDVHDTMCKVRMELHRE